MARIANIVFYQFNGERENMVQTCIFYTDGTVKNVSYEDGLEACEAKMRELNVTSKDAFREMINKNVVHVISGQELEDNFRNYISTVDKLDAKSMKDIIDAARSEIDPKKLVRRQTTARPVVNETEEEAKQVQQPVIIPSKNDIAAGKNEENSFQTPATTTNVEDIFAGIDEEIEETRKNGTVNNKNQQNNFAAPVVIPTKGKETPTAPVASQSDTESKEEKTSTVAPVVIPTKDNTESTATPSKGNNTEIITGEDELDAEFLDSLVEEDEDSKGSKVTPVAPVIIPTKGKETPAAPVANQTNTDSKEEKSSTVAPVVIPTATNTDANKGNNEDVISGDDELEEEDFDISTRASGDENYADDDDEEVISDDYLDDYDDEELEDEEEKVGFFAKIGNWFKRGFQKLKDFGVKRLAILGLALGLAGGAVYGCSAHQSKEGKMLKSNITTTSTDLNEAERGVDLILVRDNNDYYDNYSYDQLLEVTNNQTQKTAMTNLGTTITAFNGPFADAYVEEGKDVRAALSFDEIVALQQAYNSYSRDEIRAYFNGADVRSADMVRSYKDASLQLMGAYVIEDSEHPVDMSTLIESEEGKEFYNRYHQMFLAAKNATTEEEKLAAINAFYQAVRTDFPITTEVRTEGIAHADDYATIEPYKLSVTPMIAAAEMIFQNYSTDYPLTDSEIDFLNDLGLCNYAKKTFERIETITLTSDEDNTNPLYEQYRDAVIYNLKKAGHYFIDNEHRELTKLDAFRKVVNWNSLGIPEGTWTYSGYTEETTETHTETVTWTENHTDYREEVTTEEKPIPEEERQRIDQEIEEENERAREEAERQAEEERQRLQQEADEEAERIRKEVEQDEQDLQERIEDANEQIRDNQDDDPTNDRPINESDLGHGVDFDDDHSDENGNLDDSVENITTDPTGDQTNEPLPDPNETGRLFDEQGAFESNNEVEIVETTSEPQARATEVAAPAAEEKAAPVVEETAPAPVVEEKIEVVTYEEPVQTETKSNQQLVDEYIASLEDSTDDYEESYQYTR